MTSDLSPVTADCNDLAKLKKMLCNKVSKKNGQSSPDTITLFSEVIATAAQKYFAAFILLICG